MLMTRDAPARHKRVNLGTLLKYKGSNWYQSFSLEMYPFHYALFFFLKSALAVFAVSRSRWPVLALGLLPRSQASQHNGEETQLISLGEINTFHKRSKIFDIKHFYGETFFFKLCYYETD
jgi:hypothetical protein